MGQEVVYCHRCQTRLTGEDFRKGRAYRVAHKATCAACLEALTAEMPLTERLEFLSQIRELETAGAEPATETRRPPSARPRNVPPVPSSTSRLPVRPGTTRAARIEAGEMETAPRSRLPLLIGGLVGAALLATTILALAFGGRRKAPASGAPDPTPRAPATPASKTPEAPPAPAGPLEEVRKFCREHPDDLAGHVKAWERILWEIHGPHLNEAKAEYEAAKKRLRESLAPALAAVEERWRHHMDREAYRAALDLLEKEQKRYETPDWRLAVDKWIRETQDRAAEAFSTLRQQAVEALTRKDAAALKTLRERVNRWGLEAYTAEISRLLEGAPLDAVPGPEPAPEKPLTPEGRAYREQWTKAISLAAARQYEDALAHLGRASRSLEEADVKEEARRDQEILERLSALLQEAFRILAATPSRTLLSLSYYDETGNRREFTGLVRRTDPYHVEFRKGKGSLFVDFQDVTGDALANLLRDRLKGENERIAAAVLCLLEGQRETAAELAGGASGKIPTKYWNLAASPPARPRPDPREAEARRLVYAADREFRSPETRGNAIEKYRYLRDQLAATEVVRRYQETILKRAEAARESVLVAAELRGSGSFKRASHEGLEAWIAQSDVSGGREAASHFVDIDFYALAQIPYRCWLFLGACCQETFTCYMQLTELKGPNPLKTSERVSYEPGQPFAAEVKLSLRNLKKTHAQHGGPKQPARWEWVEIPLPKFAAAGPKKLRILAEHQGFGIAFAVISSLRKGPPDEGETKELARIPPPPPDLPERGEPTPCEWLLAGPFDARLDAAQPPEGKFNPGASMKGRGGAAVKWTLQQVPVQDGNLARINFKSWYPGNDMSAYALIHVQAPKDMDAWLWVGSDDGVKVWVNGQVVHTNDRDRSVKVDEDQVQIRLKAGWNRLLFKVRDKHGDWGLAARLADRDKKPLPGLHYDPLGGEE